MSSPSASSEVNVNVPAPPVSPVSGGGGGLAGPTALYVWPWFTPLSYGVGPVPEVSTFPVASPLPADPSLLADVEYFTPRESREVPSPAGRVVIDHDSSSQRGVHALTQTIDNEQKTTFR